VNDNDVIGAPME